MAENPRIEELRRRVLADPASIAFAALAEEFRRIGRYDDAVQTCRTGLQRHPAYLSARVTLGRALIETGDFDGAREELETVLRTAPENLAALRGLEQIHERLGHSAEMDPHIADIMKTMHAESIRVAAHPPPKPVSAAPEPGPELAPAPAPDPELSLGSAPESGSPSSQEPLDDASFGDASFDVAQGREGRREAAGSVETPTDPFAGFAPMTKPAAAPDFSFDLTAALTGEPAPDPAAGAPFDIAPDQSFDLAMDPLIEPAVVEQSWEAGPDPGVLATLARLERFLDAIHSLRA